MIRRSLFAGALAFCSSLGFAQSRPAPVWQMNWGDHFCTLIRLPDAGTPFIFAIRTVPGSFTHALRMTRRERASPPSDVSEVVLMPSGESFAVRSGTAPREEGANIVTVDTLPERFWEVFAESTSLRLQDDGRIRHEVPLSHAAAATRSFRGCVTSALREWGVDEAAGRALSRRPSSSNNFGLNDAYYPPAALHGETQGQMVVRLTVNDQGRASACAVVATSGSAILDGAVCPIVLRRARFSVPLDANGRPTTATVVNAIAWLIEQ